MAYELYMLGLSIHTAPLAIREALSFTSLEARRLLHDATCHIPQLEAVILSTCNRTEFYLATPADTPIVEPWLALLQQARPAIQHLEWTGRRQVLRGGEAARHLFRVACGLDSAILGDVQILGQVKEAMAVAADAATFGSTLRQTFHQAIHVGKRARSDTSIGHGAASIGSALANMLAKYYPATAASQHPQILIIGAGDAARNIGQHLATRRLGTLTFINRTHSKARDLAQRCAGHAVPWSALPSALQHADVVIAATIAPQPLLRRPMLEALAQQHPHRPPLLIDAGVPRNIEPGSPLPLIDLDAIQELQEDVLSQRRAAIPLVEKLVVDEHHAWEQWRMAHPTEALIKNLYQEAARLSHDVAHEITAQADLSMTQAERIVLRAFKLLLADHARHLRGLPASQRQPKGTPSLVAHDTALRSA